MRSLRRYLGVAGLAVLLCGPRFAWAVENVSVLMVGNSYTAGTWQDLKGFLDADPDYTASLSTITPGGWQLWQHFEEGAAPGTITNAGPWDFVILQEQSQVPAYAHLSVDWWHTFYTFGALPLTDLAIDAGAKVVLFQTWARATNDTATLQYFAYDPIVMQDALTTSYGDAGTLLGVKVAPVGEAWEDALQANPALTLHQSDLSHPSSAGSYLTGAVLYETLTRKRSADVSYLGGLSQANADFLRGIAQGVLPQPNLDIEPQLPDDNLAISEETVPGSVVYTAVATPYSGYYGPVPVLRYEILSGNAAGAFSMNPTSGVLSVVGTLDASATPEHPLRVLATDYNNWCDAGVVTVKVLTAFGYWMKDYTVSGDGSGDDPDGDRVVNRDEWLADTDPSASNSFLHVRTEWIPGTGQWRISFDSSAQRIYQLDCSTQLVPSSWGRVRTNWVGTGLEMEWVVPEGSESGIYRVTAGRP